MFFLVLWYAVPTVDVTKPYDNERLSAAGVRYRVEKMRERANWKEKAQHTYGEMGRESIKLATRG